MRQNRKNVPDQGAALRSQQGRQNQPLGQGSYKDPAYEFAGEDNHATSPDAHTSAGADDPGTGPYRDPEAGKGSTGEGMSGWRPQLRDL